MGASQGLRREGDNSAALQDDVFPWFHIVQWCAEDAPSNCVFTWDLAGIQEEAAHLTEDVDSFLRKCPETLPGTSGFTMDDDTNFAEWAEALLEWSQPLRKLRYRLVPSKLKEAVFWSRYFAGLRSAVRRRLFSAETGEDMAEIVLGDADGLQATGSADGDTEETGPAEENGLGQVGNGETHQPAADDVAASCIGQGSGAAGDLDLLPASRGGSIDGAGGNEPCALAGQEPRAALEPLSGNGGVKFEEVARHRDQASAWIVIKGRVYDPTSFLDEHPGGRASILRKAGGDATQEFEAIHPSAAWGRLEDFFVGPLQKAA